MREGRKWVCVGGEGRGSGKRMLPVFAFCTELQVAADRWSPRRLCSMHKGDEIQSGGDGVCAKNSLYSCQNKAQSTRECS